MEIRKLLEDAFTLLCQINVKDMDVERMAQAKQILKLAYSQLTESKDGSDNSG